MRAPCYWTPVNAVRFPKEAYLPRPVLPRLCLPQHPDEHRPKRPVLLAVDQEFGEGAALWVAPELSDPVCPLEVGKHQHVEQLGAGSGAERVEAFSESPLKFVGSHGRRLRGPTVAARVLPTRTP